MNNLEQTVSMMCSDDYVDRFKAEYYQTKIRFNKLSNMLGRWDSGQLKFVPTCPRSIYTLQIKAMSDYLAILESRAVMEGIKL